MLTATHAPLLVYFSSLSGNTARFVDKLGVRAVRIPLHSTDAALVVDEPFVLVTPTYGGGQGRGEEKGAVPKQVIRFLNDERAEDHRSQRATRAWLAEAFTSSEHFCVAGEIISRKCRVPHLYRLEVFGTPEDVDRVSDGLERWWKLR